MDQSLVASAFPAVNVLCTRPISPVYDFHHRLALYLAIFFILTTPLHRYLSVAAGSFIVLYAGTAAIHSWAFALLPSDQLSTSSLDAYPVNVLLQICIFALAVLLYIRVDLGRYFSKWLAFLGFQIWVYFSFMASNYARYLKFEGNMEDSGLLARDVPCQALTTSTDMTGLFAAGADVACRNPCTAENGSSRLLPILWGSINTETMTYRSKETINDADPFWPVAFGVLAILMSVTLIANTESNIRRTRAVVYNYLLAGKATWVRKQIARVAAATWFLWSLFCLGALALAFPLIIYGGELQLSSYPVARGCAMMQWGPWALGMAIAVAVSRLLPRKAGSDKDAEKVATVQPKSVFQDSKAMVLENVKEFGNWWSEVDQKAEFENGAAADEEAPLLTDEEPEDVSSEKMLDEKSSS